MVFSKSLVKDGVVISLVAYLEFIKGGGATFDKLKRCNIAESHTEFVAGVRLVF